MHNITLLPHSDRKKIEMQKCAALLIHNLKYGKVSRYDVKVEINKVDEDSREYFREMLNKYRGMQ